jgi:MFS family permease
VIGSPVSGLLLGINWLGYEGWRWVFILEGLPSVVLGVVTLFYLTDWPREAKWLPPDEREWIAGELERERERKRKARPLSILQAFRQKDVLLLVAGYFHRDGAVPGGLDRHADRGLALGPDGGAALSHGPADVVRGRGARARLRRG